MAHACMRPRGVFFVTTFPTVDQKHRTFLRFRDEDLLHISYVQFWKRAGFSFKHEVLLSQLSQLYNSILREVPRSQGASTFRLIRTR